MKIIPEANNHVKLELNMSSYAPEILLDVNEGVWGDKRFVIIHMQEPRGNPMKPFEISFITEDEGQKTFIVNSVKISVRREKRQPQP